jgi:hypothetical protein
MQRCHMHMCVLSCGMHPVYCAVLAESLNMIQVKFSLQKPYHGWGVWSHSCHRGPITSQSMWDLWWTKLHQDRFSSEYLFSPVTIIPPKFHTRHHLPVALSSMTNGRSPGTSQKLRRFRQSGNIECESAATFSVFKGCVMADAVSRWLLPSDAQGSIPG